MIAPLAFMLVMIATTVDVPYCVSYAATVDRAIHEAVALREPAPGNWWRAEAYRECTDQGGWE